jgi:hypothetical protein
MSAIWAQPGEEELRFHVLDGPAADECVHLNEDGGALERFGLRQVSVADR